MGRVGVWVTTGLEEKEEVGGGRRGGGAGTPTRVCVVDNLPSVVHEGPVWNKKHVGDTDVEVLANLRHQQVQDAGHGVYLSSCKCMYICAK